MSWKGALRSITAAQRRAEREALQRKRELERQRKRKENLQEIEQAAYEVEVFENHIDIITSIHKDCGSNWDWGKLKTSNPPAKPKRTNKFENSAQSILKSYKPSFIDKILKRDLSKRTELMEKVKIGRIRDEAEYNQTLEDYSQAYADWELITDLAEKILDGNENAYIEAIEEADPFGEISQLGSRINFKPYGEKVIEAEIHVNSEEVIPNTEKTQLKSGKLSEKTMSKTKFYELYQDYICGVVLRIARELLALLPIEVAIVTAYGKLLNTKTGYREDKPILSVIIPRETLNQLNFQMLDPSDSMSNFIHNMKFLKTKGFQPIQKLSPADIDPPK